MPFSRERGALLVWWAVVITLAAVTLWQLPTQARHLRSDVEAGSRDRLHRELQPVRSVGLDDQLFRAAERSIPRGASFDVVTGRATGVTDPLLLRWARRFARYWLLPRRLASDPGQAGWIISYGRRLRATDSRFERVIEVGPGLALAEVGPR